MVYSLRSPAVVVEELTFVEDDFKSRRRKYTAPTEVVLPYQPVEAPAWDKHKGSHPTKPARFQRLQRWSNQAQCYEQITYGAIFVTVLSVVVSYSLKFLH